MGIVLGDNRYGKAGIRVVRIHRDGPRHELRDLTVATALRGDFTAAHTGGNQARVLPTDSQKNTCYAFAKEREVGAIEDFALALGRHFVDDVDPVEEARVEVEEFGWDRVPVDGAGHDHTWVRRGPEVRTTVVTVAGPAAWVVSGLRELVLLKSTGSEFTGFLTDAYTTLPETHDRVLSTALVARWRHAGPGLERDRTGWDRTWDSVRRTLLERFATVHSLALQQTLWEMGRGVLEAHPDIAEIRLSAPNRHHLLVDLAPFGLENRNEVFHAADRPYGLIEATVLRDDAPEAGPAWHAVPGFT